MYCRECGAKLVDGAQYCISCGTPTHSQVVPEVPRANGPVPPLSSDSHGVVLTPAPAPSVRRGRKPATTLALCLLWMLLIFVFEIAGYLVGTLLHADVDTSATVGGAIGAIAGIVVLGGRTLLVTSAGSMVQALKKGWWLIACSFGLLLFDLVMLVTEGEFQVAEGWPLRLLGTLVLCAAIGIAEEGMYRGLVLGGLLDVCGRTRRGLFVAAIVSSVLFGMAHIEWWALQPDVLVIAQAVLKIAQTGTFGFFLAALVVRTGSIWESALLHGLDDFLLLFGSVVLSGESLELEYVSAGPDGMEIIILYLIMIALYIPLVVSGIRMLKEAPVPEQGAFHKE